MQSHSPLKNVKERLHFLIPRDIPDSLRFLKSLSSHREGKRPMFLSSDDDSWDHIDTTSDASFSELSNDWVVGLGNEPKLSLSSPLQHRRAALLGPIRVISTVFAATSMSLLVHVETTTSYSANAKPLNSVSSLATTTPVTQNSIVLPDEVEITHKVFFNVRISRQDGTFYVRDDIDLAADPYNQVFTGQLVLGLFGKDTPNHVEKFLSYLGLDTMFEDDPYPSYSRSVFSKFDQATGVLTAGVIPSLEVTELNGNNVLKYGGRLLPASLWIERGGGSSASKKITHIGKGLLTHKLLDPTPVFGITTRTDTTILDPSHVVFGRILLDESSTDFLSRISVVPTYSIDRPATSTIGSDEESIMEEAADLLFTAQREFFRSAAKSFGDTRVEKVYEGKLLRRVEVTQVGMLPMEK